MAKDFDPIEYNYELADKSPTDGVFIFQKIIKKECMITDIIEIAYWSRQKSWCIYIMTDNLKQFLPGKKIFEDNRVISLFIGEIKNDFDYQFIMKRIITDPEILIQIGS